MDALPDPSESLKSAVARRVLVELGASLDRVADQQRTIAEQQAQLAEVKQRWQEEWGAALSALAKREAALLEREVILAVQEQSAQNAEQAVQARATQLWRRERALDCRDTQVAQREASIATERSRHIARLRMQGAALQSRAGYLARLQARWENERRVEMDRQRMLRESCKQERDEHREERELLRLKLAAVAQRERALLEREFLVAQAEQQLLATDPEPSAAQAELERRLEKLHEVVGRPVRGLERQQRELERAQRALECARLACAQDQEWVECERGRLQGLVREAESRHAKLTARKSRWQARLRGHRLEQQRLRQHVRELEQQLERLAVLLLDSPATGSELKLAA